MMFDWDRLSAADYQTACAILGWPIYSRRPDLVIGPDGSNPYLYRWHLIPRNEKANVYFHIQVASDPERPLHDHPWDNTSVILSGGYDEVWDTNPSNFPQAGTEFAMAISRCLRVGDVVYRKATEAHRLILPPDIPYTMTIFSTGPRVRDWGFWFPEGWRNADDVLAMENGMSIMKEEAREDTQGR